MHVYTFQLTDGQFFEAFLSISDHPEKLVVEAGFPCPGLPLDIAHAYWQDSGQPALDFAAHHHGEIPWRESV